jgi:hypothetical protein
MAAVASEPVVGVTTFWPTGRLELAGKNRPAAGFDGQVSVMELPFERR